MIPDCLHAWFAEQGYGLVLASRPVTGGCISNGVVLTTKSGATFFLKTHPGVPQDFFAREAEGLLALQVEGGPVVPKPFLHGKNYILLEDLMPAPHQPDYWRAFGRQLARLHLHNHSRFGFEENNYIGSTPQPNPWMEDGDRFFAEQRLLFQAQLARQRGLLAREDAQRVERLVARLPELIPPQPASLIHGDLWGGNVISDARGAPAIIDPAAHYGWAEAELAMTTLFGSFPAEFYAAYEEIRPLVSNYNSRFPIYNLYHLLNHLNLFGQGYLSQVQSVLHKFTG